VSREPNGPAVREDATFEARLDKLADIRRFVEDACRRSGAPDSACFDLKLAVDEACTNVIEHGYAGRAGTIELSVDAGSEGLRITIRDRGAAFEPSSVPAADVSARCEDRPIGGLGWHLIRSSVDEIDYERDPSGVNRLTLVKRSGSWKSG
jgi:serine/threonine-protein kinase RsbW